MRIDKSTDWQAIYDKLLANSRSLNPNDFLDAATMISNLNTMVNELSKLEVIARQTGRHRHYDAAMEKINEEIETVENLIFMGVLAT